MLSPGDAVPCEVLPGRWFWGRIVEIRGNAAVVVVWDQIGNLRSKSFCDLAYLNGLLETWIVNGGKPSLFYENGMLVENTVVFDRLSIGPDLELVKAMALHC